MGVEPDTLPSARTLEDWYQEGLIDTQRHWPGRGKGSESHYLPGTAEKVVALLEILDERRSFDWARMVLFYRGFNVDLEHLRGSYARSLAILLEQGNIDRAELNSAIEAEVSRHSRKGQKQLLASAFDEKPSAVLGSVLRNMVRVLLDQDDGLLLPEDTAEIAVAHGVPLDIWEMLDLEEIESFEDKLDIDWIQKAMLEVTESALLKARSYLKEGLRDTGIEAAELENYFVPFVSLVALFSPEVPPPR